VLLWASFFVLLFSIVAASVCLLMVLAVVTICPRLDTFLDNMDTLPGFADARRAFENSGVISVLDSGEKRAFFFLPTVGLADGVNNAYLDALNKKEVRSFVLNQEGAWNLLLGACPLRIVP